MAGLSESRRVTSDSNVRAPETESVSVDWAAAYLGALEASLGQKIKAAKAAGVSPRTAQRRRASDTQFAAEERERMEIVKDLVESEITRRAVEGVTRKRYDRNGRLISEEVEYSDVLLLRLAERTETGSWRQKQQIEQTGVITFKTREERKAALEKARKAMAAAGTMHPLSVTGSPADAPHRTPVNNVPRKRSNVIQTAPIAG